MEAERGSRTLEAWFRSKYRKPLENKSWEEVTKGEVLRDYYFDLALELNELKNTVGQVDLERLTELERLLSGEQASDGPTGDQWLDDFMSGDDEDERVEESDDAYYTWKSDVDGH